MEYLKTLSKVTRGDQQEVGFRAVDLALLGEKSFDIPLSFVLKNNSFEDFVVGNEMQYKIATIISSTKTLNQKYIDIREVMLKGKFPQELIKELHDAFKSLVVDKKADVNDLLKDDDHPFVTLVLSTNYKMNAESREGIIINVHNFEDFLDAVRECWACLFTADMLAYRQNNNISAKNLNASIIIHNMKSCDVSFETYSGMSTNNEKILVRSYFGFPDLSNRTEKDEFRLNREFLKIEYQGIAVQTHRLTRGLDDKLDRVALGAMGEEQKINDKIVMEIARLAKKASNILGSHVKLSGYVKDDEVKVYLCDRLIIDASNLDQQSYTEQVINEEKIFDEEDLSVLEKPRPTQPEELIEEEIEESIEQDIVEEPIEENIDEVDSSSLESDYTKDTVDLENKNVIEEKEEHTFVLNEDPEEDAKKELAEEESEDNYKEVEEVEEVGDDEDDSFDDDLEAPIPQDENEDYTEEDNEDEDEYEDDFVEAVEEKKKADQQQESDIDEIGDLEDEDDFILNDDLEEQESINLDEVVEDYNDSEEDVDESDSEDTVIEEVEIEEDDDEEFYLAYEKVKHKLLNKYEERFRKLAPDDLVDVFIELNNEVIIPYEQDIGFLLRIFEQEEEYTDEEKTKLLSSIDKFLQQFD